MTPRAAEKLNARMLDVCARYLLGEFPRVDGEAVRSLAEEAGLTPSYAFAVLFAQCAGLDVERDRDDLELFLRRVEPAIREEDPRRYANDPYYANVTPSGAAKGRWRLARLAYEPYELFVSDDLASFPDGSVVPRLGFFPSPFHYPAVLEGDTVWMSVTPNEINTIAPAAAQARGRVLALGLGMGYYPYMALRRGAVSSVTVIERDENAIRLFDECLRPFFPRGQDLRVLHADAFDYMRSDDAGNYDTVFCDIWHDVSDGLPLYRELKKLERPGIRYSYWIEKTMKAYME